MKKISILKNSHWLVETELKINIAVFYFCLTQKNMAALLTVIASHCDLS